MHRDPESCLAEAARRWGAHPSSWPVPARKAPGFFDRKFFGSSATLADERLSEVFGPISQQMRDRFWTEPGQSPYEDAGGAMLRRYRAMVGLPVDRHPSYLTVIDHLGTHSPRNMMVNDAGRPTAAPRNRDGGGRG
jgi:hypothetical protein